MIECMKKIARKQNMVGDEKVTVCMSFQVTNRLSAESWEVLGGECKVLGNAIDNPELLEV